jgi:hypothetical protein
MAHARPERLLSAPRSGKTDMKFLQSCDNPFSRTPGLRQNSRVYVWVKWRANLSEEWDRFCLR